MILDTNIAFSCARIGPVSGSKPGEKGARQFALLLLAFEDKHLQPKWETPAVTGLTLIDSIFQLLFRHDQPLSETQIGKFLGLKHGEPDFALLAKDRRFVQAEPQFWAATPLPKLMKDSALSEVEFVITDIETTGSIKGVDRIIDLAAIRVKGGKVLGEFDQLVNPQKHISRHIAELTGISNKDVEGAPLIEEVMPKFVEFAKDAVFVAHNAPFDFYFVNAEINRLGLTPSSAPVPVCTFAIAKKLLPQLHACGVTGLSRHFNLTMDDRHRAMPDVVATKFFLNRFIEDLQAQGVVSLFGLIQFQKDRLTRDQIQKRIKRQELKGKRHPRSRSSA